MVDSDEPVAAPATPPPEPAPVVPPPETLGQMLRSARLAQDLTFEQLSAELRIEAKQLKALEEERFEEIGVPVFVKGYLKQYGTRLGLDFRDLLAEYYKQTTLADVQVQPSRTIKLRDDRQVASWLVASVVLLTVVVGLAVWWWNGGGFARAPAARSSSTPEVTAIPAPAQPAPAPQTQPRVEPAPVAPPATVPAADAAPVSAPTANAVANASPAAAAANVEPVAANDSAAPVVAIPLEFTFEQESWAEVTDGRGERLLFGLTAAGRRVTVQGEPPFAVVLGNANGVRLNVDGEPYSIPTVGRESGLARFSVDVAEE